MLAGNHGINVINMIRLGISGGMEIHTIPKKIVLETLDSENMSVINVERLAGGYSPVVSYRYFAEKNEQSKLSKPSTVL